MVTGPGTMNAVAIGHPRSLHVLLVEDDPQAARVVAKDFGSRGIRVTVARTVAEGREFLHASSTEVDVVILDLRLPDGRGESLLPDIEGCSRRPPVLITSACLSQLQVEALEYRPAAVPKPVTTETLLRMVRVLAEGYARPIIKRFVAHFKLTKREAEALTLAVHGQRAKEIAQQMCCSEQMVYAHLAHACKKTSSRDYHEVVGKVFAFACHTVDHSCDHHETFIAAIRPRACK